MKKGELSPKQRVALAALIGGANHTEAAQLAGVHMNAITGWMKQPAFLAALREADADRLASVTRTLADLAKLAGDALRAVLEDQEAPAAARIRAADVVLNHLMRLKELHDLEGRILQLEAKEGNHA